MFPLKEEKIVYVARVHPFIVFLKTLGFLILAITPFLLVFYVKHTLNLSLSPDLNSILLFFYFLYLSLLWMLYFFVWTDYHLDGWILTNKRLIDIEQKGLFNRDISTLTYDKIEDINFQVNGVIDTFIKMGDINIQTAATTKEFSFLNVNNPAKVKNAIQSLQKKYIKLSKQKQKNEVI